MNHCSKLKSNYNNVTSGMSEIIIWKTMADYIRQDTIIKWIENCCLFGFKNYFLGKECACLGHWKRHRLLLYRPYAITASWHQYRKLCRPGKYISATKIFTIRKSIPSVRNTTALSLKMSDPSYAEPEREISGRRCAWIQAHAWTLAPMSGSGYVYSIVIKLSPIKNYIFYLI